MPTQDNKKRGQLRYTFIFLFIVISCIPILGLGIISLLNISNTHKKNISVIEQQALNSSSNIINEFFTKIIDTLSTNFDTLDQNTIKESENSWQQTYVKKFAEDNPAFLEVSFINLQGKEVAKYSKINTSSSLLYLSELELFKSSLKGKVAVSDVHETINGKAVTIAVPSVLNGNVFNVVMAEVSIEPLIKMLDKVRVYETGYILLFDNKGTPVVSNNANKLDFYGWDRVSNILNGMTFNGLSSVDRYESIIDSMPVVSSGNMVSIIPNLNWALIVEWPISESDKIIEDFRNTVLITIIISIIIVLLMALLFSNRLVKPIKALEERAKEIESGNFDKQVSISTNDELEELADSFNGMSVGLKRLEELKNEFVYVAAHELRAPVTAIKGYMELIFDGSGGTITPEMEHLLSPVKKSNERLVNLVNDLLKVARSEAGKLEISISPADIKKEISAIVDEAHPLALKRNITVTYDQSVELPLVNINTGSFKEVIMNFVSNAIKYGKDNGSIIISHEVKDGFVYTSIKDDGRGMSEEDQKHLFEKFFRAGDVKNTSIEGTGLGLFITKELVEKMGGTLSVSSKLGEGTCFTVAFSISNVKI